LQAKYAPTTQWQQRLKGFLRADPAREGRVRLRALPPHDELLALQKAPEEQAHPDELLFQTVHQASELWLKFGTAEVRPRNG